MAIIFPITWSQNRIQFSPDRMGLAMDVIAVAFLGSWLKSLTLALAMERGGTELNLKMPV